MKRRLSAVLLALGMSLSVFSMGVYAEETEAVTEQVTEAVTEVDAVEAETEVAAETEAAMSEEEYMNQVLASYCAQVAMWTDEEIEQLVEGDDLTGAAIAANWKSVKSELGNFVEVTGATSNAEGTELTGTAVYDGVEEGTTVTVVLSVNEETQAMTMNWNVDYPMSVLLKQAGLNTIMGLGIVFIVLAFLAWLIGQMKIIPELLNKGSKKAAPEAPKAAPAPAAAPVVAEEEEYVDDLELVAVITAAIAASQNTSSDGFVVRSIKKANKKNWQRA